MAKSASPQTKFSEPTSPRTHECRSPSLQTQVFKAGPEFPLAQMPSVPLQIQLSKCAAQQTNGSEVAVSQTQEYKVSKSQVKVASEPTRYTQLCSAQLVQTQMPQVPPFQRQVSHLALLQARDPQVLPAQAKVYQVQSPQTLVSQVPRQSQPVNLASHPQKPVHQAPLIQAQVPSAVLPQWQLSQALLSQYRLSQMLLSQNQVYQALLTQVQTSLVSSSQGSQSTSRQTEIPEASNSPVKGCQDPLSQSQMFLIPHNEEQAKKRSQSHSQTSKATPLQSKLSQTSPSNTRVPLTPPSQTKASQMSPSDVEMDQLSPSQPRVSHMLTHPNRCSTSDAFYPTSASPGASWKARNEPVTSYDTSRHSGHQSANMSSCYPYRSTISSWTRGSTISSNTTVKPSYNAHDYWGSSNRENTTGKLKWKTIGTITVIMMGCLIFALYVYSFKLMID